MLLLPGITALVSWNFKNVHHGAKRPELQLTSVTALFAPLGIALAMHLLGYGLVSLRWAAAVQLGGASGRSLGTLIGNPYEMAIALALDSAKASAASLFAFALKDPEAVLQNGLSGAQLRHSFMSIFAASGGLDRQLGWCERPESGHRTSIFMTISHTPPLPGEVMHVDRMSRRIRVVHVRVMRLAGVISSTGYSASLG